MIHWGEEEVLFETSEGGLVPCSVDHLVEALAGPGQDPTDVSLIRQATIAVLHYFRTECGQGQISVDAFARALLKVLRGTGCQLPGVTAGTAPRRVEETDLAQLAGESGEGGELLFFPRLRGELRQRLERAPALIRFYGLRHCVKRLTGARRWSGRCQHLSDQIVDYLRRCLDNEPASRRCSLMIR